MVIMKVLIAQPIPTAGIDLLKRHYDVLESDHVLGREELITAIGDKDALVCAMHKIDAEVINAGKNLKIISKLAVGYDDIDIKFAGERGIMVTNAPGVLTQTVSELVFAHILALARRLPEADHYVRAGNFKQWSFDLMVGGEIKGKTLGIIGFGAIGQRLVPMAKGFGLKVVYSNQQGEIPEFENDADVKYATKDELLKVADFVVLLVSLTVETKHLITARELALMKTTAFLINLARGPVVNEADLVRALQDKTIAGAGLDVFEFEPNVSAELLAMPNTILTLHIGSATVEARAELSLKAARNVVDTLEGRGCENIVNREYLRTE